MSGPELLPSTISAPISDERNSSRAVSQLGTSSRNLPTISQVFGSLSGSDAGFSFLYSSIFASYMFIHIVRMEVKERSDRSRSSQMAWYKY